MFRTMTLVAGLLVAAPAAAQTVTIGFENLTPTQPYTNSTGPAGFYENGQNLSGSFASGGATFNNSYDSTYGSWSGWSYSTVADTTTAGYDNQYAAYVRPTNPPSVGSVGAGVSATYGVGYQDTYNNIVPTITLPEGYRPDSIQITNTTYAALAVRDGYYGARSFTDGDYFKLTITGTDAANNPTGSVNFLLSDYTTSAHTIVSDWTTVSLAGLNSATTKLAFTMTSSDPLDPNPAYLINTPTYFAADDLIVSAVVPVPEPATAGLAAAAGLGLVWRRLRRA